MKNRETDNNILNNKPGAIPIRYEVEIAPLTMIMHLFITVVFLSLLINNLVNSNVNLKTIGFFGAFAIFLMSLVKHLTTHFDILLDKEKLVVTKHVYKVKHASYSINLKDITSLKINPSVDGNSYWDLRFTKIYDKTKETLTITYNTEELILGENFKDFNAKSLLEKINYIKNSLL